MPHVDPARNGYVMDLSSGDPARYRATIDPDDPNSCYALALQLIGPDRTVLEVGCAVGCMSAALRQQGCRVVGIEQDEVAAVEAKEHCDDVVVADVETLDFADAVGGTRFDAILFGDVLEHLRDPIQVLRAARSVLAPEGCVVASIPNVAHGAIRLALLKGDFEYRPWGLLDATHLRFFTRSSIETMFHEAGFVITDLERTVADLFETEIALDPADFSSSVVREVRSDPEALTYQFVLRAVPRGFQAHVVEPAPPDAARQIAELRAELSRTHAALAEASSRLKRLEQRPSVVAYRLGRRLARAAQRRLSAGRGA